MSKYFINKINDMNESMNDLILLWKKVFMDYKYDAGRFEWLYKKRPESPTTTWVASIDEEKILVGCGSIYPRNFYINGECIKGAVAYDFAVLKEHRVYGPALALQKAIVKESQESGFDLLFVYPNKESSGIFRSAGYTSTGMADCWERIINSKKQFASRIRQNFVVKVVSKIFDVYLAIRHIFNFRIFYKSFSTAIKKDCSIEFDAIFKRTLSSGGIVPDRSSMFLNWRYSDNYQTKHQYFCLYDLKNKELCAYIIFTIKESMLVIKDIESVSDKYSDCLLWKFISFARKSNFTMIVLNFFGKRSFEKLLKKHFFIKRPTQREYLFSSSERLAKKQIELLKNRENFQFFFG
jgi:predicted acetyltransferase